MPANTGTSSLRRSRDLSIHCAEQRRPDQKVPASADAGAHSLLQMTKIGQEKELNEVFVKIAEPQGEVTKPRRVVSDGAIFLRQDPDQSRRRRLLGYLGFTALLIVAFIKPLCSLVV